MKEIPPKKLKLAWPFKLFKFKGFGIEEVQCKDLGPFDAGETCCPALSG